MYQNQYNKSDASKVASSIGIITIASATFMLTTQNIADSEYHDMSKGISIEQSYKDSGITIKLYPHSKEEYVRTQYQEQTIDKKSKEMQRRFQSMNHSFMRYSEGFPTEKQVHISLMANALCKFDFNDDSIDTVLKLSNGLTLSISCFVDEDEDAPMVFSIHRGKTLLVSDELPVEEIVRKINSVPA